MQIDGINSKGQDNCPHGAKQSVLTKATWFYSSQKPLNMNGKVDRMLEKGYQIDIIYTDFAKAFDRVPHQRLLQKMKNLGITESTLSWIRVFLSEGIQCVRVENVFSSWKPVKSGIPQGSVLWPVIFVIFINDTPDYVQSMCQLFTDDAKIFRSVNSQEDIRILHEDLSDLTIWADRWQLPFNIDKCKSPHIGRNNPDHTYEMNGQQLKHVNEEKDLGVLIDNDLKFHKQTVEAVKKGKSVLGLIKKSFAIHGERTLPLLYKSIVRPHLEYGNVIWGPFFRGDIIAIENVQRRATKLVPLLKGLTYEERLRALNLPLAHRRRRGDMIYTNKILTGKKT